MSYKGAIIIQGPSEYVSELKQAWKGYDLIWSTWKGEEGHYDSDDIVLFNEMPEERGTQNIALQQITTLKGILKAKDLGYERVLKWRSDMIPTNANDFLNLFNLDSVNMFYFHNVREGYFIDYFMEGSVGDIYNMWMINDIHPLYAEKALTDRIIKLKLTNIEFMGKKLNELNDVLWLKRNIKLSEYKNNNQFTIIINNDKSNNF